MRPELRCVATALVALLPLTAVAETPAPPAGALPIYDTTSIGSLAIEAASRAAVDSGRRLFVNFGTNDCAPCRVVNDAIYEEPFFSAFIAEFVPVFMNVAPGSRNQPLLARYGIEADAGLPAVVISDAKMRVDEATKKGELAAAGAQGKGAVQDWILKRFSRKAD